jgi:hypothetical protein
MAAVIAGLLETNATLNRSHVIFNRPTKPLGEVLARLLFNTTL